MGFRFTSYMNVRVRIMMFETKKDNETGHENSSQHSQNHNIYHTQWNEWQTVRAN